MAATKSVLPAFQAWMDGVGIQHSDAVRLVGSAAGALGVQATRDIAEGERLCTIPKAACLSIRTTELADVIEAEELGGGLGLVLAVLHEMSRGEASKWYGYFQALPPREYLPLFWSDSQLQLLQGTELAERVESDRQAAAEDFQEHVLPLLDKYPGRLTRDFITLPNFQVAASFVASRAFGVDEWHGDAMVPLADIFNHKASVVELGEGYEVHGAADSDSDDEEDEDSAEEEEESDGGNSSNDSEGGDGEQEEEEERGSSGSEAADAAAEHHHHHHHRHRSSSKRHKHDGDCCNVSGCEHGHGHAHSSGRSAGGGQEPGGSHEADDGGSALPAVMSSGPAAIYGLQSANGLHLRLEMGIVDRDEETLEIVAASAVPAGAEVHNTYGELGNSELVKKYGFALRQNPFTAVTLDKQRLLAVAAKALGPRRWKARSRVLRDQTEVLEEDEEPFEALPNGHISASLFVALRVLGASDDEAASWTSIGDALRLPAAAPTAAPAHGGKCGASSGGAAEEEAEEEEADEEQEEGPHLGAVQVWPVLDAEGQPLAASAADAAGGPPADAAEQPGGYAALLPASMWRLLQEEVHQRQAAYAAPLQQNLEQLSGQELEWGQEGQGQGDAGVRMGAPSPEQRVAERAALMLRITEQEVLRDLEEALKRRLAALGHGGAARQQEEGEVKGAEKEEGQQRQQARKGRRGTAAVAAGKGSGKGAAGVPATAGRKRKQR